MHPQLEVLLEVQDLHSQREELRKEETLHEVETDVFEVQIEEALAQLEQKAEELVQRLDTAVQRRYRSLSGKGMRVVVPVISGTCYGCFMAVPTAWASERNEEIDVCQNCGRFLYHVD